MREYNLVWIGDPNSKYFSIVGFKNRTITSRNQDDICLQKIKIIRKVICIIWDH